MAYAKWPPLLHSFTSIYFTDGYTTPAGAAGAALVYRDATLLWSLLPGASTYRPELVGILGALRHIATATTDMVIHTDSLSAIATLSEEVTSDNTPWQSEGGSPQA